MPSTSGFLQRQSACGNHAPACGEREGCKGARVMLQRKPDAQSEAPPIPPIVHDVLRSPGQPLGAATRDFMEARFGHDFSRVRLHSGETAARSAQAVNALAYTVGHNVVFARGQYAPESAAGRRVLAHELSHTIQQGADAAGARTNLRISEPNDAAEKEADSAAARVVTDVPLREGFTSRGPALQRQTPGGETEKKPPEKQDAGQVLVDGLKTVAEQAKDNNPKVKKVVIDPIKDRLKGEWNRLGTGEKVATVGVGAAAVGMAGGGLLSSPGGRKALEGVNLATPLTLIPYMPLDSFKYTLPSGTAPDKRLFKFETGFKADDLIDLYTKPRGLPKMSLSVNMQWGYDPASDRLTILGGDASLGLVPGLSLSAGAYKDVLRPPQTFIGPEGQVTQIKKSIPEFGKPQPIPDVRIMVNVDLLKFKPGDLVRQLKGIFR
jgi:hypothetical protein